MNDTPTPADAPTHAHPSLGMVELGPWRLLELRGWSAHGVVYRVEPLDSPGTGPFALKLALRAGDARFHREAQLLRRVLHPNVPRLHDAGVWDHPAGPFPYLVMDWIEGVSLYDWGREQQRSSRQMMKVLAPLARALAATHAADAVHRDIKGDNVLVRAEDGEPVLLDFGAGDFRGAPTLTHEVLPPGTPGYRSPEALRFQWRFYRTPGARYEPGPADDLYAFGVMAWRLVTGTYPPPVLPDELRDPSTPVPESPDELVTVSPELAGLIRQLLSDNPAARGSAVQVAEALEHAARTAGHEADQSISLRPPDASAMQKGSYQGQPRTAGKWLPWQAVAKGLVATVGLATLWALHERAQLERETRRLGVNVSLAQAVHGAQGKQQEASPAVVTFEIPKTPLPGQARHPCKKWEAEINGGCWGRSEAKKPPCREREFEWQEGCYYAVMVPAPPATSEQK